MAGDRGFLTPAVVAERRIAPGAFERHFAEKFRRPLRKALFFAWREGLGTAIRKSRSKVAERRIERGQALMVAEVETGGERLLGVTRSLGGPLRFDPRLLFRARDGETSPERMVLTPEALALLEAYLPVPECPLAEALAAAVAAGNAGLEAAEVCGGDPMAEGVQGGRPAVGVRPRGRPGVYFLGFGGYIREQVLPHFRGDVVAALDHKAALIRAATAPAFPVHDDPSEILDAIARDPRPLVIVATYHSEHARLARTVLDANPVAAVVVEKPAALTAAEGAALAALRRGGAWIEVGYNRRHAPLTIALREGFRDVPRPWVFTATIKELKLPASHWYLWDNQGTRLSGNVCHWLDLARYLIGAAPREVSAVGTDESVVVSVAFGDGSVAAITASAYGDDLRGVTERIELRGAGAAGVVDDFHELALSRAGRTRRIRRRLRDKGHAAMYREVRRRWLAGEEPAYAAEDLEVVARMTEAAVEALRHGAPSAMKDVAVGPGTPAAGSGGAEAVSVVSAPVVSAR